MENEKNLQNNGSTATQTAVSENTNYEGDLKSLEKLAEAQKKYTISAPLFLMFAEYLGYVGKTLSWVDSLCALKTKLEPYKMKFIEVEAVTVLKEAQKKYTQKKMREIYDSLYEVILYLYDENLKEMGITTEKVTIEDI